MYTKHKHALSRFRCSNHKLSIERQRSTHDRNERWCNYCKNNGSNVIEDEYPFMFICPLYNDERSHHNTKYITFPYQQTLSYLFNT